MNNVFVKAKFLGKDRWQHYRHGCTYRLQLAPGRLWFHQRGLSYGTKPVLIQRTGLLGLLSRGFWPYASWDEFLTDWEEMRDENKNL